MIAIIQGDITKEKIDVIVNAANSGLRGGGGVDGAIHRAAGPSVMAECRKIGSCPTGSAVATGAGNLKAKKIFHAVGPVWRGGGSGEAELLKTCYTKCFELAKNMELKSIAFPAISTGVYAFPKAEAARIAIEVGLGFENDFQEIRYVCFSGEDLGLYQKIFEELGGETRRTRGGGK